MCPDLALAALRGHSFGEHRRDLVEPVKHPKRVRQHKQGRLARDARPGADDQLRVARSISTPLVFHNHGKPLAWNRWRADVWHPALIAAGSLPGRRTSCGIRSPRLAPRRRADFRPRERDGSREREPDVRDLRTLGGRDGRTGGASPLGVGSPGAKDGGGYGMKNSCPIAGAARPVCTGWDSASISPARTRARCGHDPSPGCAADHANSGKARSSFGRPTSRR